MGPWARAVGGGQGHPSMLRGDTKYLVNLGSHTLWRALAPSGLLVLHMQGHAISLPAAPRVQNCYRLLLRNCALQRR